MFVPTESADGLPDPSPANNLPLVDISTAVTAPVPLPIKAPFAVSEVAPVPPLPTARVDDRPAAVPDVFWLPDVFTPGKLILAEPLKLTPPISLAVANIVAVAALPVVEPELPEVLPVTLPVRFPANPVAVSTPEFELKVKFVPDLGGKSPVAAVVNNTLQVVSEDSSATVTAVLTPGRSILAEPLKDTPPMFLAVANIVAVAAFPVVLPDVPLVFPVTFPVKLPTKLVAVKAPVPELKARLLPDLGGKSPVAAVTNNGKHVVSVDSSATVIVVGT